MINEPCKNPNCKSFGQPHPNCRCYSEGGVIENYCNQSRVHHKDCEFYAEGGTVHSMPEQTQAPLNPAVVLGNAAAHHGLLSLIKDVGNVSRDPDKHAKSFEKAKTHLLENNPEKAQTQLHGTPLVGSIGQNDLSEIMPHLNQPLINQDSNPRGLRGAVDYLHSAQKGDKSLSRHMNGIFDTIKSADRIEPDKETRSELVEFLKDAETEPQRLLDIGGEIGHYLPDHMPHFGEMVGKAVSYFKTLKPIQSQESPLDEVSPPDKGEVERYHRQLDIAQNPMLIVQHMRDGTIQPQDLVTVGTIYPALHQSMINKANEALVEAKTKKKEITYKQKMGLSALLGQPLDSTMTPGSMQAIIASQSHQQMQNQQKAQSGPKKASGVELKQINKVDEMSETPLEARQINRNRH